MPDPLKLREAFKVYWDEIQRCIDGQAYWALLHVTVCLPDICAALQAYDGETRKKRYIAWCKQNFRNPKLNPTQRYRMRCKVLHQGRSTTDGHRWKYTGFAFGQPSSTGAIDHLSVKVGLLYVDVGKLAGETKAAVEAWIEKRERNPKRSHAQNIAKNLKTLVRVESSVAIYAPTARAVAGMGGSAGPLPLESGSVEYRNVTKSP
jgi:hypothetical protein